MQKSYYSRAVILGAALSAIGGLGGMSSEPRHTVIDESSPFPPPPLKDTTMQAIAQTQDSAVKARFHSGFQHVMGMEFENGNTVYGRVLHVAGRKVLVIAAERNDTPDVWTSIITMHEGEDQTGAIFGTWEGAKDSVLASISACSTKAMRKIVNRGLVIAGHDDKQV